MKTRIPCLPPAPTAALPGSEEKIRVLTARFRLGVSLWHPLDARPRGDAFLANVPRAETGANFCLAS
jgi:hypothetical protein